MTELFTVEPSLSPRLRWMEKHGVSVLDNGQDFGPDDECPETGERLYRFCAHLAKYDGPFPPNQAGFGDTQDEALCDLAKKLGLRLWNEQPLNPDHCASDEVALFDPGEN